VPKNVKIIKNNSRFLLWIAALLMAFSCNPPVAMEAFMRTPSQMGAYCFSFDLEPDTVDFNIFITARFDCPDSVLSALGDIPVRMTTFSPELRMREDTLYFPMESPVASSRYHKDYRCLYRSKVHGQGHWMLTVTPLRQMPDDFLGFGMQIINTEYGKR